MSPHQVHIVDVFAEEKYAGNQLAVITDAAGLAPADMQRIAREINFSETTFLLADRPRAGGYDVRIFTPAAEIPFAGHPTIGTAYVLRNEVLRSDAPRIVLNLEIGQVAVAVENEADGRQLFWMAAPYPSFGNTFDAKPFAELLGLDGSDIDDRYPVEEVSLGVPFTFVPLRTLDAVRRARFRQDRYERLRHLGFNPCIFLFSPQTYSPDNQINARLFAVPFGVTEDPATGSANAGLAAYILRHRYSPGDHIAIRVEQGYEVGRRSLLRIEARREGEKAVIRVGGHVVPTFRGVLRS